MPGTVLSMQNIYLVKKNYANPLEKDTKPPEGDNSMKFVYHQLNDIAIVSCPHLARNLKCTRSKPPLACAELQ